MAARAAGQRQPRVARRPVDVAGLQQLQQARENRISRIELSSEQELPEHLDETPHGPLWEALAQGETMKVLTNFSVEGAAS